MRKMGSFWLVFVALAALLLASVVACDEEEEEEAPTATPTAAVTGTPAETPTVVTESPGITDTEILIGVHGPLSGTWGAAYAPVIAGVEAYFKYVNAEEDGACGRDIILKIEDDQYLPARAVDAVKKLLDRDNVFAIIASIGTAAHSAVWEDLNDRGVPDLWIMSGAHKFGSEPEKYPWSVPLLPDYYIEGTIFGKYISENMPGKNVGLLRQNDDWGQDVQDGLSNGLDPDKNELVAVQTYELTDISIRSQVTNLKNAGVEIVVAASNPPSTSQLIREADRLDWHPQFFIDYVNSDPMMFLYASPELMEGVITLQGNKMSHWTDDPDVAEHHRVMQEYSEMPAGNFTIVGAAAAALTVEALRATCDNLTRQGLMDAVHTIFRGYQGAITLEGITTDLSPTDHFATEAMRMIRAHNGEWEYFGEIVSFRD